MPLASKLLLKLQLMQFVR